MFTELDEAFFVLSQDLKLVCLCEIKKSYHIEWFAQTDDDFFEYIKYKHGFLKIGIAETEHDAKMMAHPVATTLFAFKTSAITTSDLLEFLRWHCPEEQILMFD